MNLIYNYKMENVYFVSQIVLVINKDTIMINIQVVRNAVRIVKIAKVSKHALDVHKDHI